MRRGQREERRAPLWIGVEVPGNLCLSMLGLCQALVMWAEESVLLEGDLSLQISFIDSVFLLGLLH